MNQDTPGTGKPTKTTPATAPATSKPPATPAPPLPALFRAIDWWAFAVTSLLVFVGYMWTISPDVGLEDSGELAVGSFYAGVPHPPGYPVWTVYTWLFTKILPFSNVAWRVAVASAFAGALGCGLIALVVSRGSSMMVEGISFLKDIERRFENSICIVSGFVAGMLMGFNGYMWSQSVIVEVYSLSVLSLMLLICFLMRWLYQPEQRKYLYWAFFFFGICLTNHMSLLVAAIGIEIAVLAAHRRLGRDLFIGNVIVYFIVLVMKSKGMVSALESKPVFALFNVIGIGSTAVAGWLLMKTADTVKWDRFGIGAVGVAISTLILLNSKSAFFKAIGGIGLLVSIWLMLDWPVLLSGLMFLLGISFYLYMPLASMSNPPMNWGYPRTAEGFMHAVKRGQYESVRPVSNWVNFPAQVQTHVVEGAIDEFSIVYVLIALLPFVFFRFMQKRERAWLIGLAALYFFLAVLLLVLLNPGLDRQSIDLHRVFFTASHAIIAIAVGYGLTLLAASLVTQYEKFRRWSLIGGAVAVALSLWGLAASIEASYTGRAGTGVQLFFSGLAHALRDGDVTLRIYGGLLLLVLAVAFLGMILIFRRKVVLSLLLAIFALMPAYSVLSHWFDNEQRGHLFGYWFGHDMFTPPFDVYPEMDRDAVLYGGTDPGRFNPTYMIFCESFTSPEDKPKDPKFDRRDVYLITQNALADGTYLNYIRAHYNRSAQIDPPFFQNFFKTRMLAPLDKLFLGIGDNIEKQRRAGTSFFREDDFVDLDAFTSRLKDQKDPVSKFVFEKLSPETQQSLGSGDDKKVRRGLVKDLNALLESGAIYDAERFAGVTLSDHSERFIKEDPKLHTRIRWNRLLLEDAYPKEIAKSIGGVYPDLEILSATPEDSARCFDEYLRDAQRRYQLNQLKPGEDFKIMDGRVQVSGQVAVMSINGLLTKVIFDKNPKHDFYIEESFPLDWMFPHLTPFGIIMKINRDPVPVITEEIVNKDHEFWSKYSERLIGNWITYETPITTICEWAEDVYLRHDLKEFKGDRKFVRDDNGQKAFSKLRSSIGGVYLWRLNLMQGIGCPPQFAANKSPAEHQRVVREAEFAMKQAFAFCPYSPEAVYRLVQFLAAQNRNDEALAVAQTCSKLDPHNEQIRSLISQIQNMRDRMQQPPKMVEAQTVIDQVTKHMQDGKTNQAIGLLDQLLANPGANADVIFFTVRSYYQLGDMGRVEKALERFVVLAPDNAEAWYDLAGLQAIFQRPQALQSLAKAIELSNARLKTDPSSPNLAVHVQTDQRFAALREKPEFKKIVGSQ